MPQIHLRSIRFWQKMFKVALSRQDDPNWIPFGFQGGIEDPEFGVVILDGKPYDTHLGQWMVPQVERVLDQDFEDTAVLHLYRFANNDPINPGTTKIMLKNFC